MLVLNSRDQQGGLWLSKNVVTINNCETIAFAPNTSHKFIAMKLIPKNVFKQPKWALGLNLLNFRKSLTARILSAIPPDHNNPLTI